MATDRIRQAIDKANKEGRIALIPYVTIDFPEPGITKNIVRAIAEAGADVIELGMPFSDPLGDGPTIQASGHQALENGVTPSTCLDTVKEIREAGIDIPIVIMGYYNNILSMGLDKFCSNALVAGVDGIIAADLPAAEADPLQDAVDRTGLVLIPLLALTSTERAIEHACKRARGFIYCISVLGVTGARSSMSERVKILAKNVRRFTDLPIGIGFGISTADHVANVAEYADSAVVGSELINRISCGNSSDAPERAGKFIRSLIPGTIRQGVAN
ncbi:MAG: tryptophan synthase subunit alpha [Chloroflexota bacterium]|nr:tryptophan synthase subunit alpha [Chloroflexota bacterium]MQG37355.1 tryptophan synthase subunit alpha [SAR202 cluster bacterium]